MIHRHRRGNRACFTLVELLVVVAIMALLMSILLPALNKAFHNAWLVNCKSNQHQLGIAAVMYAQDADGYTAYSNLLPLENSGVPGLNIGWLYDGRNSWAEWVSKPFKPEDSDQVKSGSFWPYVGAKEVFHCPASPYPFILGVNRITSYLMTDQVNEYWELQGGIEVPTIKLPTHKFSGFNSGDVLFFEPEQWKPTNDAITYGDKAFLGWHDGSDLPIDMATRCAYYGVPLVFPPYHMYRGVMTCFDGHVENIDEDEWQAATTSSDFYSRKRTRFNCSPERMD